MDEYSFFAPDDPNDRADGVSKVTGKARYAADYQVPGIAYAVLVGSTIAKGTIRTIDTKNAERAPGVLGVITHLNRMEIPGYRSVEGDTGPVGMKLLNGPKIYFDGQPVAIVAADTYERAVHAASLVKIGYEKEVSVTSLGEEALARARKPRNQGLAEYLRGKAGAWQDAAVQVKEEYTVTQEVHNPMELGSIIAVWEDGKKLTVYDKTQGVKASQRDYARLFGLQPDDVHVVAPFVGGGFGMALRTWPYQVAAILTALQFNRPVKLMLTRMQMFTLVGYRPHTLQTVAIGASLEGKITGISHQATAVTASYEDFTEGTVNATKFLYASPNVDTSYRLVPLDVGVPIWMRGPGEATGLFALESAMDEMAYKLGLDPLEFRLRNHADTDPQRDLPWSSKFLKECYTLGAESIGWKGRPSAPGSQKENGWLVGYGMSTGVFGASRSAASARARLGADGRLLVQSAATDIGPGTSTMMVKVAAEALSLPVSLISYELGDSALPPAPTQGGSGITSAVGSAVYDVCTAVKEQLGELAVAGKEAPFPGVEKDRLGFSAGTVSHDGKKITYAELIRRNGLPHIEIQRDSKGGGQERQKYSFYSFSVHFTKVHVQPETGVVRVVQVATCGDAGKIVSPKTARSQMVGGVVGGIGMALTEEASYDERFGRFVNNNFADYHVPVHADIPEISVHFVDKPDPYINPMGAKGMGEIALIGYAASVANAVFNATGKRIRTIPITPDKILL